jgi:hypothetical protein
MAALAVSAQLDDTYAPLIVAVRVLAFALAALAAYGMGRFTNATPWARRVASIATVALGAFALGSLWLAAVTLGVATVSAGMLVIIGSSLLVGLGALVVTIRVVATAIDEPALANGITIVGVGGGVTFLPLGQILTRLPAHHTAAVIALAVVMVGVTLGNLVALTKLAAALRARAPEPPRAIVHE